MYNDFFAPPRHSKVKPKTTPPPNKSSKVRFHEQVRVKKIKASGKNLPVSMMYVPNDDEDGDEDDYVGGEGFEDGFGESMLLDEDEEDGEDEVIEEGNDHDDQIPEDENTSEEEDDSELDTDDEQRETIARLKDDLFAEDDESEEQSM
jgi:U3 small nucleolar RNA-associated protein MPP10